ncbi:MAG: phosphonate ABC transporter, permease protein PhnE [Cytophagaceae bacterium]|nr:phosphonate ABC transporter, permease protein PhnE [Cytophagaceae bacterium]MDW8456439.1 phosphonate ABC transporter, permease protein PhnE [Cytophagaceae bacterium]
MNKRLNIIKAFCIDTGIWVYIVFTVNIVLNKISGISHQKTYYEDMPSYLVQGLLIATILFFIKGCSLGKDILKTTLPQSQAYYKRPSTYIMCMVFLLTILSGWYISEFSLNDLFSMDGLEKATRLFSSLFSPNFKVLPKAVSEAIETIYMAFMATFVAIPISFLLSFFAAKNLMSQTISQKIVYNVVRFILNYTRSVEPLIWAIIFIVWVGIGPFAGTLALMLHSVASLTKLYSEQIENMDDGPYEAIKATGAHPILGIWYGVVPQIIIPFLSFTIYRWDINVRMATIIGLVGGGGIGELIIQYTGLSMWNEVGMIIIVLAAIVWSMDYLSSIIRQALK